MPCKFHRCVQPREYSPRTDADSCNRTSTLEETSIRYVAEENIKIITPEVPRVLMSTAGRYFKRWDQETKEFVSNVRDEYPED